MQIERLDPTGLPATANRFTHVVRVSGGTTLYLSGQVGFTADGELVGPGDHYLQSKQAFANVITALGAAGASFRDVVKATYYVARLDPVALEGFMRAMDEALGPDADFPSASTMVGVQSLAYPELLVEIDVTAVVD